jgi:starvation-inducible DNA-binding protein
MKTEKQLSKAFATNFMLYWNTHVAHVNTVGRNFSSDHEFLGEIYEDAQSTIDALAEFMRILGCDMPSNLQTVIDIAEISSNKSVLKDIGYLKSTLDNVETMIAEYRLLYDAAEEDEECGLSNFVQDRIIVHQKQAWKLKSILGERK